MNRQFAALCVSVLLPTGVMAATVTPEQAKAVPPGTAFVGIAAGQFEAGKAIPQDATGQVELIRTTDGYTYFHAHGGRGAAEAEKVTCNDISKAGGKGNATINCELAGGKQVRFEWLDQDKVQYEYWFSMKHKAGQTRNQPGQASATLVKKAPVRSGKVIPPGTYKVDFDASLGWASVTYVLAASGQFTELGNNPREGTWQEIDGDFCHIDREAYCYTLVSKTAGDKSIKLEYRKPDGSKGYGVTWTRQ